MILMQAIESMHGVLVTVGFAAGNFTGPVGYCTIAAMRVEKDASVLGSPIVALSGEWPCPEHRDIVSCVFGGLHALDAELSRKLWKQSELPSTEA